LEVDLPSQQQQQVVIMSSSHAVMVVQIRQIFFVQAVMVA
jgi:hypothetical protein